MFSSYYFRPVTNNETHLGETNFRWKDTWFIDCHSTNALQVTSDRNFKKDIVDIDLGLTFVKKLRPVSFRWKEGSHGRYHSGIIAQELHETLKEETKQDYGMICVDKTTGNYSVRYDELIAPLIKAIQDLSKIQDLRSREAALYKAKIEDLSNELENVRSQISDPQSSKKVNTHEFTMRLPDQGATSTLPHKLDKKKIKNYEVMVELQDGSMVKPSSDPSFGYSAFINGTNLFIKTIGSDIAGSISKWIIFV